MPEAIGERCLWIGSEERLLVVVSEGWAATETRNKSRSCDSKEYTQRAELRFQQHGWDAPITQVKGEPRDCKPQILKSRKEKPDDHDIWSSGQTHYADPTSVEALLSKMFQSTCTRCYFTKLTLDPSRLIVRRGEYLAEIFLLINYFTSTWMVVYMARITHSSKNVKTQDARRKRIMIMQDKKVETDKNQCFKSCMHGWDCHSSKDQDPFSLRQTPVTTHEEKPSKRDWRQQ
jgi:hypothetical protein